MAPFWGADPPSLVRFGVTAGWGFTLVPNIDETLESVRFSTRIGDGSAPIGFAEDRELSQLSASGLQRGSGRWRANGVNCLRLADVALDANDAFETHPPVPGGVSGPLSTGAVLRRQRQRQHADRLPEPLTLAFRAESGVTRHKLWQHAGVTVALLGVTPLGSISSQPRRTSGTEQASRQTKPLGRGAGLCGYGGTPPSARSCRAVTAP